jgi:transglutaminase-like putative cysteine protease
MTVRISSLAPGEEARAVVTFEVKRGTLLAPLDTGIYVLPKAPKRDRNLRPFLAPSPYIESTSPQIRELAGQIGVEEPRAWDRVEAIYDWVSKNIDFVDNRGGVVKTTDQTLRDRTGDCDELTSLFVAICRAGDVPARTVRVPGHCYGEFYLEDDEGRGHWFACDATRPSPFGEVTDERPILQKGDNLLLAEPGSRRKKKHRFLPDTVTMTDQRGSSPRVEIILEPVTE